MDVEKFKELYKGKFNCQKTTTLGLLFWAAQNIPDSEKIQHISGFYGLSQGNSDYKTSAGVITVTDKNLYYFTSDLPIIPFPFRSGAVSLRNIESVEINGGFTKCLTIRIANIPYNFHLIDHALTLQSAVLDAQEKLKKK